MSIVSRVDRINQPPISLIEYLTFNHKPFVVDPKQQIPCLEFVLYVIEHSNSRAKLYASMLAAELISNFGSSYRYERNRLSVYARRFNQLGVALYDLSEWKKDWDKQPEGKGSRRHMDDDDEDERAQR